MKKVFIIITMSLVKVNVKMQIDTNPDRIYIYNKSTVAYTKKANSTDGLKSTDSEYSEIINYLNEMTNISVFNRLMNGISINAKPEQDLDGTFISYASDLKTSHIAVELVYNGVKDSIVYYNGNSKTVSYSTIIFIIPVSDKVSDVAIYFGLYNGSDREPTYKNCVPVYVKAQPKKLANYVNKLTENNS